MRILLSVVLFWFIPVLLAAQQDKGIVYFSFDNGLSWNNKSTGLPDNIDLTDIVSDQNTLMLATKQSGVFVFDFQKNQWTQTISSPETRKNINAACLNRGQLLLGTEGDGIYTSHDKGKSWRAFNAGLINLIIRKIIVADDQLFAATNGGLYVFNQKANAWSLEFGNGLQVNGMTCLRGKFFAGTSQGVWSRNASSQWQQIASNVSIHNMGSDNESVYALTYSELFILSVDAKTLQSDQAGLPKNLYTFQIVSKDNFVFAAQWDGVYRKEKNEPWQISADGLPHKFPVTELVVFNELLVAGSSDWVKH